MNLITYYLISKKIYFRRFRLCSVCKTRVPKYTPLVGILIAEITISRRYMSPVPQSPVKSVQRAPEPRSEFWHRHAPLDRLHKPRVP